MRLLVVIPARGGSKGVPRKNLLECHGRPLLAWSIEHARACAAELVDGKAGEPIETAIVVSTDDAAIAEVARAHGVPVLERPAELATDEALTDAVVAHVVRSYDRFPAARPDLVAVLQPTVPMRRPGLLTACVARLLDTGADSVHSVYPLHFVWWREGARYANGEREIAWRTQTARRPRRQDMEARELMYHEDGSVYVCTADLIRKTGGRIGAKAECVVTEATIDIDTPRDFALAARELELCQ